MKPRKTKVGSAVVGGQPADSLYKSRAMKRSLFAAKKNSSLAPGGIKPAFPIARHYSNASRAERIFPGISANPILAARRRPIIRRSSVVRWKPLFPPPIRHGGGRSRREHRRSSRPLIITTGNRQSLATPYFQRLATSVFMKRKPSAASCRSLSYILRQIFVAGTIFSRASPNASITIAPS